MRLGWSSIRARVRYPDLQSFGIPRKYTVGWECSIGIATGYGLDGPGIESRWGRDFPHPSRPAF